MKTIENGKELTAEIAELLKDATRDQKLIIKGILIGAKELDEETESEKKAG